MTGTSKEVRLGMGCVFHHTPKAPQVCHFPVPANTALLLHSACREEIHTFGLDPLWNFV